MAKPKKQRSKDSKTKNPMRHERGKEPEAGNANQPSWKSHEKVVVDTSSKVMRLSMSSICWRYQWRPASMLPNRGMNQTALMGWRRAHWSNGGSQDLKM